MKILEAERRQRGLTQTALARRIRIHPSLIAHMEAGRWIPSPTAPAVRRLVRFLGRPLEELLQEAPEPALAIAEGKRHA